METEKRKIVLDILDHWINTEFLTQEPEDKRWNKKPVFTADFKKIRNEIDLKAKAHKGKRKDLFVITFGHVNHKMFMSYFLKRHKKIKPSGMADITFAENGYFAFAKSYYLYDEEEGKAVFAGSEYSPLFIADLILRTGGRITDLDSGCYNDFIKENPHPEKLFKSEINRVLRYYKKYIKADIDKEIEEQAYGMRLDHKQAESFSGPDGINSFYIKDLELLRNWIADDKFGQTPYEETVLNLILNEYAEAGSEGRINISPRNPDKAAVYMLLEKYLSLSMYPMGKWPGENRSVSGNENRKIGYRPYLMQQLAINMCKNDASCIFTVNGPPGTGKTTLLKETIADVLTSKVKRMADVLAENGFSADCFFEKRNSITVLKEEYKDLYKYGILIASETNTAVENITLDFCDELSEYGKYKTLITGDEKLSRYLKLPITAALGKTTNYQQYWKKIESYINKSGKRAINTIIENETKTFLKLYSEVESRRKRLLFENRESITRILADYRDNPENAQKSNPCEDDEFDYLREELFIRAWRLHQLIAYNSKAIRDCFSVFMRNLKVRNFADKEDDLEDNKFIYNSLFFVSPVVSTTFASLNRMFRGIELKELFGLLIVDESGQVLPQDAVGALIRASKALIVGDTKQIPPVVVPTKEFAYRFSCPETITKEIITPGSFGERKIDENNTPSLQLYADLINPYGTMIDKTWVGCPLVVHSRCISPMFEISNSLSYDGTMINNTGKLSEDEEEKKGFVLDKSCWIQVKGKESTAEKNHFVRRQADVVTKMVLEKCIKAQKDGKTSIDLFVISPFVSVSEGLKNYIRNYIKKREEKSHNIEALVLMKNWIEDKNTKSIGTIHTFQGSQADEVIFLLGCDARSRKSAEWVSKNMVNVAASRAKYRLYIVGDKFLYNKELKEHPVNRARLILGSENIIGPVKLNEKLKSSFPVATRKEKLFYTCPVCGSDVIRGKDNGWHCKAYKKCGMNFSIGTAELNSTAIRDLLAGKDTWFHESGFGESMWHHLSHEIETGTDGKFYFKTIEECEDDETAFSPYEYTKNKPPMLLCNCSKLVQDLRKDKELRESSNVSYFDLMILDAIYTLQYEKKKSKFTDYDVFKLLTGMSKPDPKSEVRAKINKQIIFRLTEQPLYKKSKKKDYLLPHVFYEKAGSSKCCFVIKKAGRNGMSPVLFDFLNEASNKNIRSSILKIPYELIDGRDEEGKTIFPNSVCWLEIKYYILYRIAYIYRQKVTSRLISFASMKKALDIDAGDCSRVEKMSKDEKKKFLSKIRVEKMRFRRRINEYLDFLKRKKYVSPDSRVIPCGSKEDGYLGIKAIEINPIPTRKHPERNNE